MRLYFSTRPIVRSNALVVEELKPNLGSYLLTKINEAKEKGLAKVVIVYQDKGIGLREIYNTIVDKLAMLNLDILIEININKLFI